MPRDKELAFHGIDKAAVAFRDDKGKPGTELHEMRYSKSIALSPVFDSQEVYGDNQLLLRVPSDQGDEGSYGATAPDMDFEKGIGTVEELENGLGSVSMQYFARFDFYYEYIAHTASGRAFKVKVWLLNVESGRSSVNNQTDTNSLTIGEQVYPLRIYGETVMDGAKEYLDENGMGRVCTKYRAVPGDVGYATFGDSVPVPMIKSGSAPAVEG